MSQIRAELSLHPVKMVLPFGLERDVVDRLEEKMSLTSTWPTCRPSRPGKGVVCCQALSPAAPLLPARTTAGLTDRPRALHVARLALERGGSRAAGGSIHSATARTCSGSVGSIRSSDVPRAVRQLAGLRPLGFRWRVGLPDCPRRSAARAGEELTQR